MKYGIWYTVEAFDVFADGSRKKQPTVNQGWQMNTCYDSMKLAKRALADVKDMLNEDFYEVSVPNSVTVKAYRKSYYHGVLAAPAYHEEHVVYHIEKYY